MKRPGRVLGILAAFVVVVAAGAGAVLLWPRDGGSQAALMPGMLAAERSASAPDISFSDAAGNPVALANFRGRVVLLNLWATWCAPCVHELPSLDRLEALRGGAGFQVVALSLDRGGAAAVTPFFESHGIGHLPVYLDARGGALRAFRARGLPTTVLIDRDGREVGRFEGAAEWDSPPALAMIDAYLR